MNCPSCNQVLQMTEREGVEIDYCPGCRGVWLDRGELDKIVERMQIARPRRDRDDDSDYGYRGGYRGKEERYYPKKKESFLSRLFDFD